MPRDQTSSDRTKNVADEEKVDGEPALFVLGGAHRRAVLAPVI